jgi:GTP-binding protein
MRSGWQRDLESYLKNNLELKLVFLLLDSRREIMENDRLMIDWLQYFQIPYILVLTKSDKISNNHYQIINSKLRNKYPNQDILRFSSINKTGREDILKIIKQITQ